MKVVSPQEGYRLWAESFDTSGSAILALESRHLAPWIAALRGRVIDVGCGTGRWMSSRKRSASTHRETCCAQRRSSRDLRDGSRRQMDGSYHFAMQPRMRRSAR
jgi:hypothetical protein